MRRALILVLVAVFATSCAAENRNDILDDLEELDPETIIDAPSAMPGNYAPANRYLVERGEYLVELLGCGACHTDGALVGEPDMSRPLAGSQTGIAYSSPLVDDYPGVVYPPNITPDKETGIGELSDMQIANAVRAGIGRHLGRRMNTMPWQGYARISDDDIEAIVGYLRSIKPIRHQIPANVKAGKPAPQPFVYFGVYRSKN